MACLEERQELHLKLVLLVLYDRHMQLPLLPRPYKAISARFIVLNNAHATFSYIPVDHYARWESHSLLMQCRESNPTITITATLEYIH